MGSESLTVTSRGETQVTVRLIPETSDGTGTLSYALSYPTTGATVNAFTLTLLADTQEVDLKSGAATSSGKLTGNKTVGSGYYLAAASLTMNNIQTTKTEIVHIYQNLSTDLALEFSDQDFKAILVFSSADSGPGSLWEAIANAPAGSTIALDLPENDRVITLRSTLAITKNLTLYGGGATLTRSGFTGSLITGTNGAALTLNRLLFKGGNAAGGGDAANGGGIRTNGSLTLESCVFAGNSAGGGGGAVYAAGTLIIRGSTFHGNSAAGSGGAVYGTGTVNLTGNIFYGNTAGTSPAVYAGGEFLHASNLTDSADWSLDGTDKLSADPSVSPLSFRPLSGGGALEMLAASPVYKLDFYGRPVPAEGGAAGTAQTSTAKGSFIVDYGPLGPGKVEISGAAPDGDGLIAGSVTLTAVENPNGVFKYWLVNGDKDPETSATLTLDMNTHAIVRAVFIVRVTALGDYAPGSLRALIDGAEPGSSIALPIKGSLNLYGDLDIAKNVVIEGNGSTLNLNGRHTTITGAATKVSISRLHFKGGKTTVVSAAAGSGGAILNGGILGLESCVFSGNQAALSSSYGGGAINSTGSLTVFGSTFYANSAGTGQGGAIRVQSGTAILQGNVFWGNTASSNPVISGTVTSRGFNISDQSVAGLNQTGDAVAPVLPFTTVSFKPFAGGAAAGIIVERPEDYPTLDFHGLTVPEINAFAGAAQGTVTLAGYVLDYAAQGHGDVQLIGGEADPDGVTDGPITLRAVNTATGTFRYWTVNGIEQPEQEPSDELELPMNAHTVARAVFSSTWMVTTGANGGSGSFREALSFVADGDAINLDGQTITLTAVLPDITMKLTILGNGATLTQSGFTPGAASQLLSFTRDAEVNISRVHFKGGRATMGGGAIYNNQGALTLESCIFSDNRVNNPSGSGNGGAVYVSVGVLNIYGCAFYGNSGTGSSGSSGGAIYSANGTKLTLESCIFSDNNVAGSNSVGTGGGAIFAGISANVTVSDCTFYGNSAATKGGAIYRTNGALTLTGNIFSGNTATTSPVVYHTSPSAATNGYNVTDKSSGTTDDAASTGWTFKESPAAAADKSLAVSFVDAEAGDFTPTSAAGLPVIPALDGFPSMYFDGTPRGANSAPGAMPLGE
jgi:predicted outer membrane repeat protein